MILITGSTGFIGKALTQRLTQEGRQVRVLIRPTSQSPDLPKGIPVDAAISSLSDERSLRSAMIGVDTIYHLVGGEWQGTRVDLAEIEIQGARNLIRVAQDAGVKRFFYLSHHGAARASAYPVLKVKGIVEEFIRQSNIDYTIFRTGLVFGPGDHFTTAIAEIAAIFYFIPLPGDGDDLVHPIWLEDLISCMVWSLDLETAVNQTYSIGGPEFLSIRQIFDLVINTLGFKRSIFYLQPVYLRILGVYIEYLFPNFPLSVYWVDYLSSDRTGELETLPRDFGLLPERISNKLDHLSSQNWRAVARKNLSRKKRS